MTTSSESLAPALLPHLGNGAPSRPRGVVGGPAGSRSLPPDALFHVEGATEGTLQWKAETIQLVNWGGFHGRVSLELHPGATLFSGGSGTGKSTLLDAYLALMMPSNTPFNGASNDAAGGRPRSSEQRNLPSYLRGKLDTTVDEEGRQVDQVLRGKGVPTWGAVGMTFVDDHGRRFTAFRAYYLPAGVTHLSSGIVMRMATFEGALDLADLEPLAPGRFDDDELKATFPGISSFSKYNPFIQKLFTRLGIGANGDGEKALQLLVSIQSGHQIRTVDELYKRMVLERPATFAAADQAIEHFDELEKTYTAMLTEQQKADLLSPLPELHATLSVARERIATMDTYGINGVGDTVMSLWSLRTEAALLDAAVISNRAQQAAAASALRAVEQRMNVLQRQLVDAQEEHRNSGGGALERLAVDITAAEARRDERIERRAALVAKTAVLSAPLGRRDQFAALQEQAATFLVRYQDALDERQQHRDALLGQRWPLAQRKKELTEERASLAARAGRVPRRLDDLRRIAAHAAGMDPADLPFLAELIDVAPEQQAWRGAIETVLGGTARLMLVPLDQLENFSRAIDALHLQGRLTFQGALHATHQDIGAGDPDHIAGKLLYADSPFSTWVREQLNDPARNALCVDDARGLVGPGYRVTRAGQTRRGTRGSHGRSEPANIIGFNSQEAIDEIDRELERTEAALVDLHHQIECVEAEVRDLVAQHTAYEAVRDVPWNDIDVDGAGADLTSLRDKREALLTGNDRLRALDAHIQHLHGEIEVARDERATRRIDIQDLDATHGPMVDRQDVVNDQVHRIDSEQRVLLTAEHCSQLDAEFSAAVAPGDPTSLPEFTANLARLLKHLTATQAAAQERVQQIERELQRIFGQYQERWPDPNLGRSASSYSDYAGILERILTTGLHERRVEWRRRVTEWSGQDLVPLAGALAEGVDDIEDRLVPINDILNDLPFGPLEDRLQIKLRRLSPDNVVRFRTQLRKLAGGATRDLPEALMEARFRELRDFMTLIRRKEDPRYRPGISDRQALLDVRRHVEVSAEQYRGDGTLRATHFSMGGKSGGETQELFAFIIGAALRFRLGDDLRARPRFAPVFLDEGFVKADAQFGGRAVQAWKGLGFQLIVGVPHDKVNGLEPHFDRLINIAKDLGTNYSYAHSMTDAAPLADHVPASAPPS